MTSRADGLPPEIAKQIHPDWRKNEAEYWTVRDQLLTKYRDQWIGFADGKGVADGRIPVDVFHNALEVDPHAFFVCVGNENQPCMIRRKSTSAPL